jgi:hypothetical protein
LGSVTAEKELMVTMDHEPAEPTDPQNDPDFISETGAGPYPPDATYSSQGVRSLGSPTPVFVPKKSIPLEESGGEGVIPTAALWAMKYRSHGHFLGRAEATIRERYGSGDGAVYILDDGRKHCLVSRMVGASPDGCTYCLVAQITMASYEQLVDQRSPVENIFDGARQACLCVVYEEVDAVSNVAVVESFDAIDQVPVEYLPPSPAIVFAESSDWDE